jgi:ethanolamine utilization protein EutP (predicted NTPase)
LNNDLTISLDAQQFKAKFEEAQKINTDIGSESKVDASEPDTSASAEQIKETLEETGEKNVPSQSPNDQEDVSDAAGEAAQEEGNKEALAGVEE